MLTRIANLIYNIFFRREKEPYVTFSYHEGSKDDSDSFGTAAHFNMLALDEVETERFLYVQAVKESDPNGITFTVNSRKGKQIYTIKPARGFIILDDYIVCNLIKGNQKSREIVGEIRLLNSIYFSVKKSHIERYDDLRPIAEGFFFKMREIVDRMRPETTSKKQLEEEIKNWKIV